MTAFEHNVYELTQQIPEGRVTTYKAIADAMGTKAYQAVGVALSKNPFAPEIPCHRVVKSDGTIGGFKGVCAGKEIQEKITLLTKEGVRVEKGAVSLSDYFFRVT